MSLFDLIFGCPHHHCSFPFTVRGKRRRTPAASVTGTYIVCLDCGHEFPYDWNQMKIVSTEPQRPAAVRAPVVAS